MNETNWASGIKTKTKDEDNAALKRAKALERKRIKAGWKWYEINPRISIFVPFGKDGKPTEQGFEMIRRLKASY